MSAAPTVGPFQARLRKARLALGQTQMNMDVLLGLSPRNWHKYETGKARPGARVIAALHALGVDVNWLFAKGLVPTGSPLVDAATPLVEASLVDAITYLVLRTQACATNGNGVALTAETIADYSGELLDARAALASVLRLTEAAVAADLPPTKDAPSLAFYLPARRTITDTELALKARADTLREILSWPLT